MFWLTVEEEQATRHVGLCSEHRHATLIPYLTTPDFEDVPAPLEEDTASAQTAKSRVGVRRGSVAEETPAAPMPEVPPADEDGRNEG